MFDLQKAKINYKLSGFSKTEAMFLTKITQPCLNKNYLNLHSNQYLYGLSFIYTWP